MALRSTEKKRKGHSRQDKGNAGVERPVWANADSFVDHLNVMIGGYEWEGSHHLHHESEGWRGKDAGQQAIALGRRDHHRHEAIELPLWEGSRGSCMPQ